MIDIGADVAEQQEISLTFGKSRAEVRWHDRRTMSFDQFGALLRRASVGIKDGACYTPATFTGTARRMDQTARIDVAVLDADCGHTLKEIRDAITAKGWTAIIHSTYSHMTAQTPIAAGPFEKWQAENTDKTVVDYLLDKKGYLPRVIKDARIVDEISEGTARNLLVEHAPCPKFRIILLLSQPWLAENFESQTEANARWRERIAALAHALDLHHDQSCVDTSRLFFLPRIRTKDARYEFEMLAGDPCPLFELADAPAPEAPLFTAAPSPHLQAVKPDHKHAVSKDGEFIDLTEWAAKYAGRFEIVKALEDKSPGVFGPRRNGVKRHIFCPNAADHVTTGNTSDATYAVNASDLPHAGLPTIKSGFVLNCMHAGCASHDRLDHMRGLLENGNLEVADLTTESFLTPEGPAVDFAGILGQKPRQAAPAASPARPVRPSNIPPALYGNLPGVMRDMHEFTVATSVKPQPSLALAATLTFFGAAIGRKAELAVYGTRANIYALAVAHSGAGKERQLSAVKEVVSAAGLFDTLIGVEEVASDAGITNAVIKQPNQVMLLDEVSFLISSTHNAKAGVHIANVTSTLLKLYSSSRTRFKGKSYADAEKIKTVDQPCVSIFGCSTPTGLFSALSSRDVNNGLLSRFCLFDAGDHDPLGAAPRRMPPPQDVIDWIIAWNNRPLNPNPLAMSGGEPVIAPLIVSMTEEALAVAQDFEVEMHAKKVAARDTGTDALYVRARENALKFALVAACSAPAITTDGKPEIDTTSLTVTGDLMRWACELSRVTITAMETGAKDEIADSQFEQKMKNIRNIIRTSGSRGTTQREIRRTSAGRLPQRELQDVLQALTDAGDIGWVEDVNLKKTRGGRPRAAYVHKNFLLPEED